MSSPADSQTDPKTILLIEDHIPMRDDIRHTLENAGYRVLTASNGKSGIRLIAQHKPDLILCDVLLPQGNGYYVFSTVKRNKETTGIPFVFMTDAHTEADETVRPGYYLTKPFTQRNLLALVEQRMAENKNVSSEEYQELEHIEALEYILKTISHELRNPICSSIGLASLLDMSNHKKNNRQEMHRIVKGIKANATRLDEITGILTDVVYQVLENYKSKTIN